MTHVLHDLVYLFAAVPALVVARRYRRLPSVVPISMRPNGPPVTYGPRWLVFLPALLIAVLLPLSALMLEASGVRFRSDAGTTLVYLLLIEVAVSVAVVLGLEAEVAVGSLRRVPSIVQWAATAVLVATVTLTLIEA